MKAILKVIRSYENQFRLGIYIPKPQAINVNAATSVEVHGINNSVLKLSKTNWYRHLGTLEDAEISNWIIKNNWNREARKPIQLLEFNLEIVNNKHVFTFVSACKYKKVSNQNRYTLDDGITIVDTKSVSNIVDFLCTK